MHIDTHSKESLFQSFANYIGKDITALNDYIELCRLRASIESKNCFNEEVFISEFRKILTTCNIAEEIDMISFYHLSRRLNNSDDSITGKNLKELLLEENPFKSFLENHNLLFFEEDNHIAFTYKGKSIDLKSEDAFFSKSVYLKKRLGYFEDEQDYCFNGFVFFDLIKTNDYYVELYYGPEFIVGLSDYLKYPELKEDYFSNSTYYCYEYLIPISKVIIDGKEQFDEQMKKDSFINSVLLRLLYHVQNGQYLFDYDNVILRISDYDDLEEKYFVNRYELEL